MPGICAKIEISYQGSQRRSALLGLVFGQGLLIQVGSLLRLSQGSLGLPVLGQVQGGNLLGLLNLLFVGADPALELVDQALHALVVLAVLISSIGELLDAALGLAQVLASISQAPVLSIKLGLQLADPGLHLVHGLLATLEGIHLGIIQALLHLLGLALQELPVPLQGLGQLLLGTELISKTSGINHGFLSLLLRQLCLSGHLIKISLE